MSEKHEAEHALVQYRSRDGQEIRLGFETVRKFLVSGKASLVTNAEILMYMGVCKSRGLNPFKRDCWLIKYSETEPAAIVTSIDYYRARAKAQPDCVGWKEGIIVRLPGGEILEREGSLILEGEQLLGGWFEATPRGWAQPLKWTVNLKRYIRRTREGQITRFWAQPEDQAEMICKVAASQGLRRCWPDEFSKVYIEEELVEGATTPELREPGALPEQEDQPAETEPETKRETKPEVGPETRPETKPEAQPETPPKPTADDLLAWLERAPASEIMAMDNYVSRNIRGMQKDEMMRVLRRWNERRRELEAAGKQ